MRSKQFFGKIHYFPVFYIESFSDTLAYILVIITLYFVHFLCITIITQANCSLDSQSIYIYYNYISVAILSNRKEAELYQKIQMAK